MSLPQVRVGQTNVTMMCLASEKIRSCSWTTPYGKVGDIQDSFRLLDKTLLNIWINF